MGGDSKNTLNPTNIRHLAITDFNLTLPLDFNFDKELFFDLVDKDRASLPQSERLKCPYKYFINDNYDINSSTPIHKYSYFSGCHFLSPTTDKHLTLTIRKEFQLKNPLSPANAKLKEYILNIKDSIFLHVRRGDYLTIKKNAEVYVNLCEGKYYEGAIKYIKSKLTKPHIFIFSNDIAWCRREFLRNLSDECREGVEVEFVTNNGEDSATQEMELMRSCKHAIIANSTFSWWASYLINNPHKIVMMPNFYGTVFPKLSYDDKTQVYDGVVLVDSYIGEIIKG